jgi:hypothetical protein
MNELIGKSGRKYEPLPIDGTQGFPQSFPLLFRGRTYQFRFYVNVAASELNDKVAFLELPSESAFLVMQVELENLDGTRQPIFLRKVVPKLEYEAENISLLFERLLVARSNLNGQGDFGSEMIGGIAPRWE